MIKVSVIVPVYNVEAYLEQCVKSLLAQTLREIEILLVNDASTDGSLELARRFAKDPRVIVLDKPHGGLGDTRNYGLRRAGGEYVAFVDSDDWLEPQAFEQLYEAASACRADMAVFNFVRENLVDGEQRVCRLPLRYPAFQADVGDRVLAALIGPDPKEEAWRNVEMLGAAWRRLYRREWFLKSGLTYPNEQAVMLEDLPVTIQAHCLAREVVYLSGAYYHYRYNPDSLSTRYRPGKLEMLAQCFQMVRQFLQGGGEYDPYEERHLAWLLRSAAHSALVNCFSPLNPAGVGGKYGEVRGILKNPLVRQAAKSDYLREGTKADRLILRVLRTGNTPVVYSFYRAYAQLLRRNSGKK